jgi:ribosomal protein S18 acetylase RimI-like enzyme
MTSYRDIGFDDIQAIREVWELNRDYHFERSIHFKDKYRGKSFEARMAEFRDEARDGLTCAADDMGKAVGYCISAIKDGVGEIESLHVKECERGSGIGKELMRAHVEWMKARGCHRIGVTVMSNNDGTISFYESLGFRKDTLYMQIPG